MFRVSLEENGTFGGAWLSREVAGLDPVVIRS
jgi:hypothetical protein